MPYYIERFNFVASQRAPRSVVTGFVLSDSNDDGVVIVTLSCGHSYISAPHFSHKYCWTPTRAPDPRPTPSRGSLNPVRGN